MKIRKTVFVLLIVSAMLSASALALSRAVWLDGKVTRVPWRADAHCYIEVDDMTYKILPGIRVSYRYLRSETAYDEEVSNVYSIASGQKIWMKVRGNDVEQIILF